jgi:hypothetical protein
MTGIPREYGRAPTKLSGFKYQTVNKKRKESVVHTNQFKKSCYQTEAIWDPMKQTRPKEIVHQKETGSQEEQC